MNGARPPTADLYTDSEAIHKFVANLSDSGRSVIALMHSYGGQVGTDALAGLGMETRKEQGLPGGVERLVYICGQANDKGQAMAYLIEKFGRLYIMPHLFDFAEDGTCFNSDPKGRLVGPGLSDEELENYVAALGRWNGKGLYQAVKNCAWREIPMAYIHTQTDMTTPIHYQHAMVEAIEAAGCNVQTFTIETGHCPNITSPEELAGIIQQIVKPIEGS
ncbi:hypothetical protein N7478_000084 [Penicillium angulare]|uniref:uncharacterized protein n=1 Tax=Penicillium angulare TaxID=116970 RepID=UPI00253F9C3E|nr:uncharacterized protein N7478_000084 [Penicillium angulare]KAJ5290833.1 hypothetical protein N7478_000084 [Penicillium angulare]